MKHVYRNLVTEYRPIKNTNPIIFLYSLNRNQNLFIKSHTKHSDSKILLNFSRRFEVRFLRFFFFFFNIKFYEFSPMHVSLLSIYYILMMLRLNIYEFVACMHGII